MTEEKKSTHKVEVVPVKLEKHPNADTLSVVNVFGGYTCCVRTADWQGITTAAYLPPDSVVDVTNPAFAFLLEQAKADGKARIKAKKLRGIISFGLLVPAPDGTSVGDDVTDLLGVTHYEPPLAHEKGGGFCMGGEVASPPEIYSVKYDLDAFRRYHQFFTAGEPVSVTEKLDGASARYVYHDGEMHCGSRETWKKEYPSYEHVTVEFLTAQGMPEEKAKETVERLHAKPKKQNLWWEVLRRTPALEKFCRDNPGVIVYGEVFGNVNCIKYGLPEGNRFAAFDLMQHGEWVDADKAQEWGVKGDLPWVPVMHPTTSVPYDFDLICKLAEGPTTVAGAAKGVIREGVVVKPIGERWDLKVGRIAFKCVSGAYLERFR